MSKKRIGIVLSAVPGYSETFFRNKIKGLQDHGFEVFLFVDQNHPKNIKAPCEIIIAPNFKVNPFLKFIRIVKTFFKAIFINTRQSYSLFQLDKADGLSLKKRVKQLLLNQFLFTKKLDWLHFGFGILAVNRENVAQAIGAKMAVSFRGFDMYLSPLKHKECYNILFLKQVHYHVLSNQMKKILIQSGLSQSMIQVIPPAIDVTCFQPKKLKQNNKLIEIITIARLHWIKGLEYTLEALALLKKGGVEFKYTIIGDGEEYERLVFAAHQLDIKQQVAFKGKMTQNEIVKELELADIYIQYSIQEGFCNAVLEAQAMGLLCVVSDADGLKENVLDAKTGWVVSKRNPTLLAEKIKELISLSDSEQQEIKRTAISRVMKNFNIKQQQVDFVKFYSE